MSTPINKNVESDSQNTKSEQMVHHTFPIQTSEVQIQDIQDLKTRLKELNQNFIQQKEEFSRLSDRWVLQGELEMKLKKIQESQEEYEKKQEMNKLLWNDQRAVNDQQWKKIVRIEKYLAGEDYLEPDYSKLEASGGSNLKQISKKKGK